MTRSENLSLGALAQRPLWVAWQTEDRGDGKPPTKVPYAPNGSKARADAPSTWGKRPDAEKRAAALPKPYGAGGVGIELAAIGDGRSLGGIDLDTCRDPGTTKLEGWAEDVIASFDSYTETSPSKTGAKVFFTYDTQGLSDIQPAMGTSKWGKQFKRGLGEHPPAIELYLGNRYFAVTDETVAGSRLDLRHVPTSTILQLIKFDGPAFAGADRRERAPAHGRLDRSRSADAFRVGKSAVRNGATFEEMCAALSQDADTSDWMREKGTANNFREAQRIFLKAKEVGPVIRVIAGELHTNATEGEAAIMSANLAIFQRGNGLVRPVVQEVPAARGRMTVSAALHEIGTHGLVDALCGCSTWEHFDARAGDWLRVNPPKQVADIILSRNGLWKLPKVVGVVTCPTLRPDGSVLSAPGYDPVTRLYHAADSAIKLMPAVQRPTRRDAEVALAELEGLLAEFPFADAVADGVSKSVAVSALITPVVRGGMSVAPLHAFRASTPGTGKSYLVDVASAIASGRPCPVAAASPEEAETEKRLTGLLLAGFPIASLDNCNGELGGDLLCQAIERPLIRLRRMGSSDIVEIESRVTMFATGNALRVRGDMVRRTLLCDLDAGLERPEKRDFQGDPVTTIMQDRGRYVSACLIIVRAFLAAGDAPELTPIASFADWSRLVRSALVWLDRPDPAQSMEAGREDDPELGELREFIEAWTSSLGSAASFTTKELAEAAEERVIDAHGSPTSYPKHKDWHDCLNRLAGERGGIKTKTLGRWLMNREGRVVERRRITRAGRASGGLWKWKIADVKIADVG